jgi:Xaa-Pro aminopeptidase
VRGDIVFHDTYGYAVGIGFPPTWLEDGGFFLSLVNHRPLTEDMVFHLPLSLRLKGRCGVGSSQTVRVTPKGGEVLSKVSLDLFVG